MFPIFFHCVCKRSLRLTYVYTLINAAFPRNNFQDKRQIDIERPEEQNMKNDPPPQPPGRVYQLGKGLDLNWVIIILGHSKKLWLEAGVILLLPVQKQPWESGRIYQLNPDSTPCGKFWIRDTMKLDRQRSQRVRKFWKVNMFELLEIKVFVTIFAWWSGSVQIMTRIRIREVQKHTDPQHCTTFFLPRKSHEDVPVLYSSVNTWKESNISVPVSSYHTISPTPRPPGNWWNGRY